MGESPSELQMEIEKLERKHTESPEGRYFVPLANAYRKMGEVEHAEHLLREGLKYHPDYLSAHIVLGRCLADRRELDAAEKEFRHVLSVDAQNLVALRSLGEIATAAGRADEAERWYRQLLEVDPMNDDARRALEVEPDFGGLESAPESLEPQHYSLDEPMDLDEVLDRSGSFEDAGPSNESDELVTETIADLYAKQGFHERAASVYRELIRRNGSTPELESALAAVEREAAAEASGEDLPGPVDEGDAEVFEDREPDSYEADPFADSFATGFGGDLEVVDSTASDDEQVGAGSISIADYLSELVSWEPGESSGAGMDLADTDEPGVRDEYLPDEPLPWEELPSEGAADQDEAADPEDALAGGAVEESSIAQPAQEEEAASEEDDLESFQAWLRSLKR